VRSTRRVAGGGLLVTGDRLHSLCGYERFDPSAAEAALIIPLFGTTEVVPCKDSAIATQAPQEAACMTRAIRECRIEAAI
jgi:hypothetical protein